jgi:hypothetical protein
MTLAGRQNAGHKLAQVVRPLVIRPRRPTHYPAEVRIGSDCVESARGTPPWVTIERLAAASLAARVDLHKQGDYVPQAPVLACEALTDLTRYLCLLGRAEDAQRELEVFT